MGASPNQIGGIPPPPDGFTLDAPSSSIPPPPSGFTLDSQAAPEPATFTERAIGVKHPIDSMKDAYDTLTHAGALAKIAGGAEKMGAGLETASQGPVTVPPAVGGLNAGPVLLARGVNFTINQAKTLYDNTIQDIKDRNLPATGGDLVALALAFLPFAKGVGAGVEAARAGEGTLSAGKAAIEEAAKSFAGVSGGAGKPEFANEIKGVPIQQTATEAGVVQGTAMKNLEAITSALPGGKALRQVQEAQQAAAEDVLGKLSDQPARGGLTAAQNFIDLGDRTKRLADPHFEAVRALPDVPVDAVRKVTEDFAENSSDLLKGEAGKAARRISPVMGDEKGVLPAELSAKLRDSLNLIVSGDDILNLRRTVSNLASKFSDDPRGFEIRAFRDSLDDAISSDLSKLPNGAKLAENYETARGLWYKAEVQQEFGKSLMKSIIDQPMKAERNLPSPESFNTIVNQLEQRKVRYGPLKGRTALEAAFPQAGDVEALKELGLMMDRSRMSGGMAARFGILGMVRGAGGLALGAPTGIMTNAAMAGVARVLSTVLAHPGGARTLLLLAKTPPTAARFGAVLGRTKAYVDAAQMQQ